MSNSLKINNKYQKNSVNCDSQSGFTLLEMAIVIIIGGILLSFMGSALLAYMKTSRINTTEFRMKEIQDAMEQYLTVNRHYPCAASRVLGPENSNFGRLAVTDCTSGAATGTVRDSGVRIGAVPTRTLNLPDDYAVDAWGNKFTFAITEILATNLQYTPDGGRVDVIDGGGTSIFGGPSMAHYVVVSHGPTGAGAFPLGSITTPPLACPAGTVLEAENCNDNRTFRTTLITSEAVGNNYFDDYLYYQGQTEPVSIIPPGAVMSFNLSSCPDGWSTYTAAQGRFVMGTATTATISRPAYGVRLVPGTTNPATAAPGESNFAIQPNMGNVVINSSLTDGNASSDSALFPPYTALLYCEKD